MLDALFRPKSVAVIGASQKELSIGNRIIKNLLDFGFTGTIYPINPKVDDIWGVKAYRSILEVPTEVDVVHLPIPAPSVPQAIEECGRKGVKIVILNGGGFAEIGPAGAAIEQDCIRKARQYGIRIFGPNCQGIINTDPEARAYCNFTFTRPEPGAVSIVALSGGVAELIHQAFSEMGVGTRLYASNGNACDISIAEIMKYYGDDEGTRAVVLYLEGLREPLAFLSTAQEVTRRKPILAMKAGRTEAGAQAAASHTGGLARHDITTDLIFEKAGVLGFSDEAELCQAAAVFASQPVPKGNRVGIITNTGGPAVIGTDVLVRGGLTIPPLSDKAEQILKKTLFREASIRNPVDLLATANAGHFRSTLDVMMDDEGIDSIYLNFVTPFFVDNDSIAKEIAAVSMQQRKPIVCNLMTDKRQFATTAAILKDGGVPCYSFPGTAARALVALTRYGQIRTRDRGTIRLFNDVDRQKAEAVLLAARNAGRRFLPAADAYELLAAYHIPIADWRTAADADEATERALEIGFPVAVKADSTFVLHKSDVGGVALNLHDGQAVRAAVQRMRKTLHTPDLKFLVQKHLPAGREVIVGGKTDDAVGRLVMFGVGGIHVEAFNDVAFKLGPVTDAEAVDMIASLKAAPLLKGARGETRADLKEIIDLIQRVSQLLMEMPGIREMDLNPVMVYEDRLCAVDVRIGVHEDAPLR